MSEFTVEAMLVEPIDLIGTSDLEIVDTFPRATVTDQFGFEKRVERLCQRVDAPIVSTRCLGRVFGRADELEDLADDESFQAVVDVPFT